jgi:hypothetical protein
VKRGNGDPDLGFSLILTTPPRRLAPDRGPNVMIVYRRNHIVGSVVAMFNNGWYRSELREPSVTHLTGLGRLVATPPPAM